MRKKIKLVSTADTGYFYTTTKNDRNTSEKLKIKKYDPIADEHVEFVEKKLKSELEVFDGSERKIRKN